MKRFIYLFIKSILIGIGTVIPGVSGGTVAVAAGEFESILRAVNNLFSAPKESFGYLCVFIPGAALGCLCAVYPARAFIAAAPSAANICFFAVSLLCTALFVYKSIGLAVKPLLLLAGIATASLFLAAKVFVRYFRGNHFPDPDFCRRCRSGGGARAPGCFVFIYASFLRAVRKIAFHDFRARNRIHTSACRGHNRRHTCFFEAA